LKTLKQMLENPLAMLLWLEGGRLAQF